MGMVLLISPFLWTGLGSMKIPTTKVTAGDFVCVYKTHPAIRPGKHQKLAGQLKPSIIYLNFDLPPLTTAGMPGEGPFGKASVQKPIWDSNAFKSLPNFTMKKTSSFLLCRQGSNFKLSRHSSYSKQQTTTLHRETKNMMHLVTRLKYQTPEARWMPTESESSRGKQGWASSYTRLKQRKNTKFDRHFVVVDEKRAWMALIIMR